MEWVERLNEAIDYMEKHLTDKIDIEQLGRIACCSSYHFQRMFTYMAGVPLSEYIRRRKMSLAAVELQSGDQKIIDIAEKYGYRSPTAFNRAFQSVHGIAPSAAKLQGAAVKSFPPMRFSIAITGGEALNYRVEKKPQFRILGISAPLYTDIESNFTAVPELWQKAVADGILEKLALKMDSSPMGILGVSACDELEQWRYFIAAASTQAAEGFEEYIIPASIWAVFSGSGTNLSVQTLERRIVTEWLPSSGYEYANAPDIEVYLNPDPQNAQYEVWIPVTPAKQA